MKYKAYSIFGSHANGYRLLAVQVLPTRPQESRCLTESTAGMDVAPRAHRKAERTYLEGSVSRETAPATERLRLVSSPVDMCEDFKCSGKSRISVRCVPYKGISDRRRGSFAGYGSPITEISELRPLKSVCAGRGDGGSPGWDEDMFHVEHSEHL